MGQQLLFNQSVSVTQRKCHGTSVQEYHLSDPNLMALGFGWRAFGSHFHLYKRTESGAWIHIFQGNTLQDIINKAQVV